MRNLARQAAQTWSQHLQVGEDPTSDFLDDAVHWHAVYSALLVAAVASNLPEKVIEFGERRDFWRWRWNDLRDRRQA